MCGRRGNEKKNIGYKWLAKWKEKTMVLAKKDLKREQIADRKKLYSTRRKYNGYPDNKYLKVLIISSYHFFSRWHTQLPKIQKIQKKAENSITQKTHLYWRKIHKLTQIYFLMICPRDYYETALNRGQADYK